MTTTETTEDGRTVITHTDDEGFRTTYTENAERTKFSLHRDCGGTETHYLDLEPIGWVHYRVHEGGGITTEDSPRYPEAEEAGTMVLAWKAVVGA